MPETLLRTKLFVPPLQPNLVPRPHLIDRLDQGLQLGRKLTLVSAPAGFGKTTLVSEWMRNLRLDAAKESEFVNRIAWLSLDEGDNDPVRFLTYFIAALNQVEGIGARIGDGALVMLQSPQPPLSEDVLTSLVNDITAIPDRIVLVLDDYHSMVSSPVDDTITFLLEHLPPQMHLIIATRDDPQLHLARLRARGQLAELRAADLRFTSSEATEFLNQVMGLNLSKDDISVLENRTEGWIAGLQLAAISMHGSKDATGFIKSFTGSHRFVLDYLIEEVLEQQSESVRSFLLQTAVLNRLTGSLCDALTGQKDGQATLETLDRANLFIIPLDNERRWYRYHHLFADLLRQRLHQTQSDGVVSLHHQASEWYEQNGFVDEAIDHALRGEYFERAAHLIEDHFGANYERRDPTTYRRWLAEIPDAFVFSEPHLCLLQAWKLFASGHLDAAERSLQTAERILDPHKDQELVSSLDNAQLTDSNRKKLLGRVEAIRSFSASYSGDRAETIRHARQALEHLPEQELALRSAVLITLSDAYANMGQMTAAYEARTDALETGKASGDTHLLMIVNLRLAEILRQQGKLQQVIDICERQHKIAAEKGISESPLAGWLLGIWGEVLVELNQLDGAEELARKGVKTAARGQDVLYKIMTNLYLVRVLFSRGDVKGVERVIESMENTARENDLPQWTLRQLSAWQARIWLVKGKLEVASQWAAEHELVPDNEPSFLNEI